MTSDAHAERSDEVGATFSKVVCLGLLFIFCIENVLRENKPKSFAKY